MSRIELDAYDEDAPFIDERADEPIPSTSDPPGQPWPRRAAPWQASSRSTIVLLATAVKFCVVTSGMLLLMPMYRLIEDAFCHVHYEDDSPDLIDEMKCKVDEVQSPLAYIVGWFGLVGAIMHLIATYPYGMLADRIGRRPTVLFSYGGLAFSFSLSPLMLGPGKYAMRENPYMLLTGSVFTLFGGGIPVLFSTLYAVASDVSTEENKASSFLYLTLGASAGGLLGPLLAGLLMDRFSPWVPMIIVLITIPIVFVMILFIPETLTVNVKKQTTEHQPPLVALRNHIAHGFKDLRNSLRMLCNINIPLCLITFFFNSARFTAGSSTLAQYISKNFGWTLAETSVLLSPLGVIHLIVLASLPKLSEVLMSSRFGFTTFDKDVFLARTCLLILTVSALIRAFSSSIGPFLFGLFVGSFGAAENPLIRSIMSNFVEPSYISRLYALVSITEVLGSFAGPPVLAWCFDKGMKLKGTWAGLPWFYLAFVCFLSWLGMVFVRAPKKNWYDNEVFGADEGDEIAPSNPVRLE